MRYGVKFKGAILLWMAIERKFDQAKRGMVTRSWWVECETGESATPFLSEEDAWAAFDRSGTGGRENFEVAPL